MMAWLPWHKLPASPKNLHTVDGVMAWSDEENETQNKANMITTKTAYKVIYLAFSTIKSFSSQRDSK